MIWPVGTCGLDLAGRLVGVGIGTRIGTIDDGDGVEGVEGNGRK